MTILMDSNSDLSSRDHVQRLYNRNVELENKRRKAAQARIPSDPSSWQQMRENYEGIVLKDHDFSEQHEIEYALWQLHYRRIEELRTHLNAALVSKGSITLENAKGPTRSGSSDRLTKIRSQFKTFLSEATGFYHDFMVKIRAKYGLPLGYFSNDPENEIILAKDGNRSDDISKGLISCHRCLIYLGDLSRYKGLYGGENDSKARDFMAASGYYMHASSLCPSSGNPHHQLAIVASYLGDELLAVYRYFRSLAVDSPFSTARENLIIAFEKNRQSYSQLLGDAKAPSVKRETVRLTGKGRKKLETRPSLKNNKFEMIHVKESPASMPEIFRAFSIRFVRLNGILFTRTSLETFGEVFSVVKSDLLGLLSSGPDEVYNFGSDAAECRLVIIRLIAILIFSVHNVNKQIENQSYAEILQRSVLLQNAFTAIFEFMSQIFERCIQLRDPSNSYLLPGIMVFVEWLACYPDIAAGVDVEEKQAGARSSFWTQFVTFLNKLLSSGFVCVNEDEDETCFFHMSRYDEGETMNRLALPEDFELRGFVPLLPAQLILDFSRNHSFGNSGGNKEKKARIERIIAAGKALANIVRFGEQGIYFSLKSKRFATGVEPHLSDDFSLSNSLEIPTVNGMEQKKFIERRKSMGVLQPKVPLHIEAEEEDEVIVFKPSVAEKFTDGIASDASSEALVPIVNAAEFNSGSCDESFLCSYDGSLLQNSLDTGPRPPASLTNFTAQSLQPIQTSNSKWVVEQQGSIANALTDLSIWHRGVTLKPDLQDSVGALHPAVFSGPVPHSLCLDTGSRWPPGTVMGSDIDSIVSAGLDSLSMKPSSVVSAGLRKNPVSRPVRHYGPPPGFRSIPPKIVDESLSGITLTNGSQPMDHYSWLDGYQLRSSMQGIGFSNLVNHSAQNPLSNINSSVGMVNFPFPGKQVSSSQIQAGNQKGLPENQFSDHLKPLQGLQLQKQQQLQKEIQESIALPEKYQGHSLWEDRFFV